MKYTSRLTALLLAVIMLIGMIPAHALAGSIDIGTWNDWVENAQQAQQGDEGETEVTTQTVTSTLTMTNTTEVVDRPEVEASLSVHEGSETDESQSVSLPIAGRLTLHAYDGAAGYQWQVQVGGVWANIMGDNDADIVLTYAKLRSALNGGSANVRCVMDNGGYVSETAVVTVDENVTYTTEESQSEITVTSEQVVGGGAAAVSTYNLRSRSADAGIMLAAEDEEQPTAYNIVIRYLFADTKEEAASPVTYQEAAGTIASGTVKHPTVMGYKASMDPLQPGVTEFDEEDLSFSFDNLSEDKVITVYYQPTTVEYTVIYHLQNVDDDNYTEQAPITKYGVTKEIVDELDDSETPEGFVRLPYDRPEIAADGSTLMEVYFDRGYYLMNFNLDGGYGVEPIYARYGADISVGDPTKAGYTFKGWATAADSTTAVTLPTEMPASNVTYYAIWEANETAPVKVIFWGENANDEEYSYLSTGVIDVAPGTEYTFSDDETVFLICDKEEHTHTAECGPICGKEEHTAHTDACLGDCTHPEHTLDCYSAGYYGFIKATKPSETLTETAENIYTYTTGSFYNRTTHYYLNIGENWYCAKNRLGNANDETRITLTCSHTHSDDCYTCEIHKHSASCYTCGLEEHTHGNGCNQYGSGLESDLWEFKSSETVTVAADGTSVINVYYDRVEFTFTFVVSRQTVHSFSAKWGSNVREKWTFTGTNGTSYSPANKDSWTGNVLYTQRIYMVEIMPAQNITFTRASGNNNSRTFYYYVESVENTAGDNKRLFENKYYDLHFTLANDFGSLYYDEDFFELEGFTRYKSARENGTEYPLSNSGTSPIDNLYFYYTRHRYALEFYNPTTLLKTETGIPYDAPLTSCDWTPDATMAPAVYEPGSVVFEGWYLNPECTGDKFDFTTATMPSGTNDGDTTLTLYANWIPVTHTVKFYLDQKEMTDGTSSITATHSDQVVTHGEKVEAEIPVPENDPYTFVGWFYMDEGVEKAFDFANMPITKDLEVYGKWSSTVMIPYTIHYVGVEGETRTEIAEPTTGFGLAGTTKTFSAKGDTDLYTEQRGAGWFPLVKSHNVEFNVEDEAAEYTFEYVKKEAVPYEVYYVTETQNNEGSLESIEIDGTTYYIVADTKTVADNHKAVVTETFKPVGGFIPDAFQKRLVVVAEGTDADGNGIVDDNRLIFFYTEDIKHAVYQVTHWIQNLDGETYTEYDNETGMDVIGATITGEAVTINGYQFVPAKSTATTADGETALTVTTTEEGASAELVAEGLQINLYYDRVLYPYKVQYFLENTTTPLHPTKTGTAMYGQEITEKPVTIDSHTCLTGSDPKSVTIRAETEAKLNVITFYYRENEATITYQVVGPEGCGTVNLKDEVESTVPGVTVSEKVKIKTGLAVGAAAEASSTAYKFVGWYDNPECTGTALSTNAEYVPTKAEGAVWQNVTYYAKFEEKNATLNYVAVGPQGATNFGSVDPTSETIKMLTGTAAGSTATAGTDYTFVGWYADEACTQAVDASWVDANNKITPTKDAAALWVDGTTYYAKFVENEVTINYVAVGPEGATNFGSVDPASETLNVLTGAAQGSTAAANEYYSFVGWYADEACTGEALSTDALYVPQKVDGKNVAATYYAKFEENEVTINYEVFGPTGCGTVALNDDDENTLPGTKVSEQILVLTGDPIGSAAAEANAGYTFAGWYSDAACTTPAEVVEGKIIAPSKKTGEDAWVDGTTYYAKFTENEVTIEYKIVDPAGNVLDTINETCGTLTSGADTAVPVFTGTPAGSTAAANAPTYKFVGWYSDPSCTEDKLLSTNAAYVPVKTYDYDASETVETLGYEAAIYYAKFEYDVGHLKITKNGMRSDESAIFSVKVTDNGAETIYQVVLSGSNNSETIVNLPNAATYEVTEQSWSWLYKTSEVSGAEGTIAGGQTQEAVFSNTRAEQWLYDESSVENVFDEK